MKIVNKIVAFLCAMTLLLPGLPVLAAEASVGYVWLEAEKMDATSTYKSSISYDKASDGIAAFIRNVSPTGAENYHADYTFEINEAGDYDIWVLSTRPDLTWVSDFTYKMDGGKAEYCISSGMNIGYVGNQNNSPYQPTTLYNTHSALGSAAMVWNKMPTSTLSAQRHTISIYPEERGLGGYIFAMDAIVIVPSYYNWTPTDSVTKPGIPDSDYTLISTDVYLKGTGVTASYDYSFTSKASDIYDIWVYGNRPDLTWISDYSLTIDDGDAVYGNYSGKNLGTGYQGNLNNSAYKPVAVTNHSTLGAISWHRFPSQIIAQGEHNLKLTIDPRSQGDYLSLVNKIAIVPQSWQWIPGDQNSVPQKNEYNGIWLEAEHFSVNNKGVLNESPGYGMSIVCADGSSSNSAGTSMLMSNRYYLKQFYRTTTAYTEIPEIIYNFRPTKSGAYDMYIVSTGASDGHVSHYEYSLNGSDYQYARLAEGYESSSGVATYDNTTNLRWNKIPNVKLSSYGVNTLKFRSGDLRSMGDIYLCMFDFIAFVPTGTGILPSSFNNDYLKRLADFEAATLGINTNMLRDDIALPATTVTGSSISWSTSNPSVITSDGKIVHNDNGKIGKAILTATVEKTIGSLSAVGTKEYEVTVIPDLYAYDVKLTYADGSKIRSKLRNSEVVNASATLLNSNGEQNAIALLAYYDNSGRLVSINKSELVDVPEGESVAVTTDLMLPYDTDGGVIKMFLWNGNMAPIADTGEYEDVSVIANVSGIELPEVINGNETYSGEIEVVLENEVDFDSEISLTLWKGKELWGVVETDAVVPTSSYFAGEKIGTEFEFSVTDGIPSGEYELRVQLNKLNTKMSENINIDLDNDINYDVTYKPMSYGTYIARKTGLYHFWYVNQAHTLIWDGEPYIPMGGMSLFSYLDKYSPTDPAGNEEVFAKDVAMLERFKAEGVTDLYINPQNLGTDIPMEAWQRLVDKLDEMGFKYGIQLNERQNGGKPLYSYYVRAARDNTSNVRVTGVTESGTVSVTINPSNFATTVVTPPSVVGGKFIVINEETSIHVQNGDVTVKANGNGTYTMSADVTIPSGRTCTVAFTPKIYSDRGRAWSNYIDYDNESYEAVAKFADALEMGDGFRLWVDLCYNETGVHNDAENARFVSDNTNAEYAQWLEEKYGTIDALNEAWLSKPAIPSFEAASQIIPIYTSPKDSNGEYYTYFALDSTNRVYQADTYNGHAWNDFWYFKSDKFTEFSNLLADNVKKYNDVPVVYKEASIYSDYFVNNVTYGGFDGVGAEAYGDIYGGAKYKQSIAYGEAESAVKTMWQIVTETETESNINVKYEQEIHGYPSEEYMHEHFTELYNGGAKGIFDFLLNGEEAGVLIHEGYSYEANPKMYPWLKSFNDILHTDEYVAKLKDNKTQFETGFYYPAATNYWTRPNRYTAVGYSDDIENFSIEFDPHSGARRIIPTSNPLVDTELLMTFMEKKPATKLFGEKLCEAVRENREGKNIVFFGFRDNIGDLPEIDKYYTDEYVTENGVTKQILNAVDGADVLYKTADGKPWAIRNGNLYIIASNDWKTMSVCEKYISDLGL